eukprot:4731191-Amphidinium_carterae.1
MSPGSMQVHALNTNERFFTIFCVILGILCSGSIAPTLVYQLSKLWSRLAEDWTAHRRRMGFEGVVLYTILRKLLRPCLDQADRLTCEWQFTHTCGV